MLVYQRVEYMYTTILDSNQSFTLILFVHSQTEAITSDWSSVGCRASGAAKHQSVTTNRMGTCQNHSKSVAKWCQLIP